MSKARHAKTLLLVLSAFAITGCNETCPKPATLKHYFWSFPPLPSPAVTKPLLSVVPQRKNPLRAWIRPYLPLLHHLLLVPMYRLWKQRKLSSISRKTS